MSGSYFKCSPSRFSYWIRSATFEHVCLNCISMSSIVQQFPRLISRPNEWTILHIIAFTFVYWEIDASIRDCSLNQSRSFIKSVETLNILNLRVILYNGKQFFDDKLQNCAKRRINEIPYDISDVIKAKEEI